MLKEIREALFKRFRGQPVTYMNEPGFLMPEDISVLEAYNKIAVATQCMQLIINYAAQVELNVCVKEKQLYKLYDKADKVEKILDFPNPYQSKGDFWRQLYLFLLAYGVVFIAVEKDGIYLLNPPDVRIETSSSPSKPIKRIVYGDAVTYKPEDVQIIRLSSLKSSYLGDGVLEKLSKEINLINKMLAYHSNVLNTGGIHKYVFRSEHILSQKIKNKIREEWKKYHAISTKTPGQPPILDGGVVLDKINITMEDLDFNKSVERLEASIAANMGVPIELLAPSSKSDLSKVLRIFMLNTVLPLVDLVCSNLTLLVNNQKEWFKLLKRDTVYIRPDYNSIYALREDILNRAKSVQALYVSGIITKTEARSAVNYPIDSSDPAANDYLVPANIAGSNLNPNTGGRPEDDEED